MPTIARLFALLAVAILPASGSEAADPGPAAALAPALPAIVRVEIVKRTRSTPGDADLLDRLGLDRPDPRNESGSGFVVDPAAGLVAAMEFVVRDAEAIALRLHDGRTVAAELLAMDEEAQLALLRAPVADLPAIAWADSGQLRPGDAVFAAGHPFDLGLLVTGGIHSGVIGPADRTSGRVYLATDAPVMPGTAGGPLFDASGRVAGVIVGSFGTSMERSVGIAVPAAVARRALERLREGAAPQASAVTDGP